MNRRAVGRSVALLIAGLGLGILLLVAGAWIFIRQAPEVLVRDMVRERLDVPADVYELEEINPGGVRLAVRDIALLGEDGDTVLASPRLAFTFDPTEAGAGVAAVLADVEVERPVVRLIQDGAGDWNLGRAVRLEANGNDVEADDGPGAVVLRDVLVRDGRVLASTPDNGALGGERAARIETARLPEIRAGGDAGWTVEVAELRADLADPEARVEDLRGRFAGSPDGDLRFALESFRTERSEVRGEGEVRLAGETPEADVRLTAAPLDLADLQWLRPDLPDGTLRLSADIRTVAPGRTTIALRDFNLLAGDSRVSGGFSATLGGETPPMIRDADLRFDPLDLSLLEALVGPAFPLGGEVRGEVATLEEGNVAGLLRLDLGADVAARDAASNEVSTLSVSGGLRVGGDDEAVRFHELRVQADPLRLAGLAPLLDDPPDLLRGTVRADVLLDGTPGELRLLEGGVAYEVGGAAPTQLTGLDGRLRLDPMRLDLQAEATPLSLATLSELFPALPFRAATLRGPIRVSASPELIEFSSDLQGEAGALALDGRVIPGDRPRFDVTADLEAFRAPLLVGTDIGAPEPVSGRVSASGTPADFDVGVRLEQDGGDVEFAGRVRTAPDVPEVVLDGRMNNFPPGILLGRPGLFRSPLSGSLAIDGGGTEPYRVDIDLDGDDSRLALDGTIRPGSRPTYALRGDVAGLDLRHLPGGETLPRTDLVAAFEIDGSGASPHDLSGRFELEAGASTVDGHPLDAATVRADVEDDLVRLDALNLAYRGTILNASGAWGIVEPAAEPIRFSLRSPDLSPLAGLLPAETISEVSVGGSVSLNGSLSGSLEAPVAEIDASGRNLRYGLWRAARLEAEVDGALEADGWRAEGALVADETMFPGYERLQTVRLEAVTDPAATAFAVYAQRSEDTDLSLSATVETEDGRPTGVTLESLLLQLQESRWQLAEASTVRWGGDAGLEVDNLRIRRFGEATGVIAADGRIPLDGEADFRLELSGVDLRDLQALLPDPPGVEGVLSLDVHVTGAVQDPRIRTDGVLTGVLYDQVATDRITLSSDYADGRMDGSMTVSAGGRTVVGARADLPLDVNLSDLSPTVEVRDDGALTSTLRADDLPVALLAAALPGLASGEGLVQANVSVGGTGGDPALDGWIGLEGGAVTLEPLGTRYSEIDGRITLNDREVGVEYLRARNRGTAELTGTVIFDEPGQPLLDLTTRLRRFRAIARTDIADMTASGEVILSGRIPQPVLAGRLVVDDGAFVLPDVGAPQGLELDDVEVGQLGADTVAAAARNGGIPVLGDLRVDGLEVAVRESVWMTSPEARIQLRGDVLVFRDADDLRIFGELIAERGTYTLNIGPLARDFDIESGRIQFTGTPDINPTLEIVAVNEVRTLGATGGGSLLRIFVNLSGTAQSPQVALTSDNRPPLPEAELLSLLIFRRPGFQLGSETGGQIAQDLLLQEVLGGVVASGLEQFLLRDLGLPVDYVRVRARPTQITDPFGQTVVEAGTQIGREIFLTAEAGFGRLFGGATRPTWGSSLEWQIDRQWSLRFAYEPLFQDELRQFIPTTVSNQFSSDIRRRWEYGFGDEDIDITPSDAEDRLPEDPGEPSPEANEAPAPPPD